MNLKELKILKSDDRGAIFDCDKVKFIRRKKCSVSADHSHEDNEILYLVNGEIELTIADETNIISVPTKIVIPPNVYHRILALSDIGMIEIREGE